MRNFVEQAEIHNSPGEVRSNCNSITFLNSGTIAATVNGVPVAVGDQYVSNGNEGEENKTLYRLAFVGGGAGEMIVIRKTYI